jgi:superfamily II DNA or RNA helicase
MKLSAEQLLAVQRCIDNATFGCFDPQGAGKTAVGINAAFAYARYPVLITVPAHLIPQWELQLSLWGVPASDIATAPRGCGRFKRLNALTSGAAFTVMSYNTWSDWDYVPLLLANHWQAFIFDESHRLRKGRRGRKGSTSTWEVVQYLRRKSRTKHTHTPIWALTGTPFITNAGDIWPFLWLCNPYRYSNREKWIQETCFTHQGTYKLEIGKVRDKEAFHSALGRYSIRRRWDQLPALASLDRRDIELPVELDPSELARHRSIKKHYYDPSTGTRFESSAEVIHALRRLSVPSKAQAVTEWLTDHPGRVLLLAWYRDTARSLAQAVSKHRHVAYIDGSTSEPNRHKAIAAYKAQRDSVLVGTIGSMKEGWDSLQIGHQVLFAEQHYLSAENEQAVSRVLRRGQSRPVLVTWMYAPKTFDMRVRRLAAKRSENINEALEAFMSEEEWT